MTDEIDFKALYETMREENEKLRLKFWKLQEASAFSWSDAIDFVEQNAVALALGLLAIYYAAHLVIDAIEMLRRKP